MAKNIQRNIGTFVKQYQRKAQRNCEPNDRSYDREIEKKVKTMDPRELSDLMHDDVSTNVPREVEDHWFNGDRIEGIDFYYNASVTVIDGKHSGEKGAVISLVSINPEPAYLIELGSGLGDIRVPQSKLRLLST